MRRDLITVAVKCARMMYDKHGQKEWAFFLNHLSAQLAEIFGLEDQDRITITVNTAEMTFQSPHLTIAVELGVEEIDDAERCACELNMWLLRESTIFIVCAVTIYVVFLKHSRIIANSYINRAQTDAADLEKVLQRLNLTG